MQKYLHILEIFCIFARSLLRAERKKLRIWQTNCRAGCAKSVLVSFYDIHRPKTNSQPGDEQDTKKNRTERINQNNQEEYCL